MRKNINLFVLSFCMLLLLNGCNASNENVREDLFQYKDSYVGDNSAVGNIAYELPGGEHLDGIELKTKEEPYGIILNYKWSASEKEYKEIAVHNATFLFALIRNAEWIDFNFHDEEYKLTKKDLKDMYGKQLSEYTSEDELRALIAEYKEDESKMNELFGE